jgi:pimeloyl-ACP methyl ester carboxylesterase
MTKRRRILRWGLGGVLLLLVLLLVGPFLVPIPPLADLPPAEALADERSRFVTVPFTGTAGISLHYQEHGREQKNGEPTFILLHGFASNLYTWDEVVAEWGEHGRVLAYDRPPFGLSAKMTPDDWTGDNPYTDEAALAQLEAFMAANEVEQAILVGNSAGGTVAMKFALAHPEKVHGLILVSPAVYTGGEVPFGALLNTPQLTRLGPLIARQFAGSDALITAAYHDPSKFTPEERAKALITTQVAKWDEAFWAFTAGRAGGGNLPLVPRLGELDVPILLITGDDDRVVPTTDTMRLAEALDTAVLEILPACGHVPQQECPEAFMPPITSWLASQGFSPTP